MDRVPRHLLEQIDRLNLVSIGQRLRTKEGWDLSRIASAERDYRRFLLLLAMNPGQTIVPWNDDLDVFWHYHILDSRKYENDCRELFGTFIHHDPNTAQDPSKYERDKQKTNLLYNDRFGSQDGGSGYSACGGSGGGTNYWWMNKDDPNSGEADSHSGSDNSSDGGTSCASSSCSASSCGGGGCGGGCGSG